MSELELEKVLAKHLSRVEAPPELRMPPLSAKSGVVRRRQWLQPLTAGIAVAAAVAILVLWFRPPSSDLHSADPAQITAWLKSRSFDVPLRQDPPASIRLTSAHVKGTTAEIDYQIAGHPAVLTVTPPSANAPDSGTYHVIRSHLVRGQLFTLACAVPEDAHMACLLCHMGREVN